MSELLSKTTGDVNIRWKLLAGASALALMVQTAWAENACAEDAEKPMVWLELGGQLSRIESGQEDFSPEIMNGRPAIFDPSQKFERPSRYTFEELGSISIAPASTGWVFNASVRYGRSKSNKHVQQQTNPEPFYKYNPTGYRVTLFPVAQKFAETTARNTEQHLVVDFSAGKDVGLGLFGKGATSVISAGVRFAQFTSQTNISLKSDPDWHFATKYNTFFHTMTNGQPFHSNIATLRAERSFRGVGPSVSWKSSMPLSGGGDATLAMDWGVNAAILFGRQKAQTHHQSTIRSLPESGPMALHGNNAVPHTVSGFPVTIDHTRSRSITVPNIGGFAGLSYRYDSAKLSFGYRADFFFGAMDGGIDTGKTYDRNFYGPYATVSIGLGG